MDIWVHKQNGKYLAHSDTYCCVHADKATAVRSVEMADAGVFFLDGFIHSFWTTKWSTGYTGVLPYGTYIPTTADPKLVRTE